MKKYVSEAIGTFALLFCGTGAIVINQEIPDSVTHVGIALTFGLIVSSMIYAVGDISGAHLNPAVTIGFWLNNSFPAREIVPYFISQAIGAFLASFTLTLMFPLNELLGSTIPHGSAMQSWVLEMILTFILMFVILSVSSGGKERGMFAGIAVGSVVLLEAMFAGPVSGASMNPIRSLAPAVVSGHIEHLWVYITAPVAGSSIAVLIWVLLKIKDSN